MTVEARVLLAEDDRGVRESLDRALRYEGFEVVTAADGRQALDRARSESPDLLVLDVMMPELDGLEVSRRLRSGGSRLPILMLTARSEVSDRVAGLEAGADDYLVKPFHMEELLARVRALLRRANGTASHVLRFGPFALDTQSQRVTREGTEVALTGFEYRMLEYFVRHRDRVVSKAELADYLYPHDEDPDSNVIEVLMGRLRRKLDPDNTLKPIDTLRGRGYRFALETVAE